MVCSKCGFLRENLAEECPRCKHLHEENVDEFVDVRPDGFECPVCGFVMDDFTEECPRCKERKEHPEQQLPAGESHEHADAPARDPLVTASGEHMAPARRVPAPPPVDQDDPYEMDEKPPLPRRDELHEELLASLTPELGWPLAIALWAVIALNTLIILMAVSVIFKVNLFAGLLGIHDVTSAMLSVGLLFGIGPVGAIIGAYNLLQQQQWGFYMFAAFALGPAIMQMLINGFKLPPLALVEIAVAFVVFFMVLSQWDRFE